MLYRKYRPKRFADVIGQNIVGDVLKMAISSGRVSHAYLFSGPRGVGKTTLARLIAKAVNCLNRNKLDSGFDKKEDRGEPCNSCDVCSAIDAESLPDVMEIDAASNRGIDEIRGLRERVKFPPMRCKYKVYIIDEVHMLTREAFNALLKTLEEPPGHAIFVLCTTEPQKVPDTIISRCQWYELRLGTQQEIVAKLSKIVESEGLKVEDGVLKLVASLGQGSFRDAESLLSMIIEATGKDEEITLERVRSILKLPSQVLIRKTVDLIEKGDARSALKKIAIMRLRGFNGEQVIESIIDEVRKRVVDALDDSLLLKLRVGILEAFIEAKRTMYLLPDPYAGIELAVFEILKNSDCFISKHQNGGENMSAGESGTHITCCQKEQQTCIEGKDKGEGKTENKANRVGESSVETKERDRDELSLFVERWNEVIKEAEEFNSHLPSMLEAAEIIRVNGDCITLLVPTVFSKRVLESKRTTEILREITQKVFGRSYKVRCTIVNEDKKIEELSEQELAALLNGEIKK